MSSITTCPAIRAGSTYNQRMWKVLTNVQGEDPRQIKQNGIGSRFDLGICADFGGGWSLFASTELCARGRVKHTELPSVLLIRELLLPHGRAAWKSVTNFIPNQPHGKISTNKRRRQAWDLLLSSMSRHVHFFH